MHCLRSVPRVQLAGATGQDREKAVRANQVENIGKGQQPAGEQTEDKNNR